jgi:hypothetical protein
MSAVPSRYNPFEFGGELKASALIDREQELDLVIRTIENGGKLFSSGRAVTARPQFWPPPRKN